MTRVQPEGPASKILQPGDKIIQVQMNFLNSLPVFFLSAFDSESVFPPFSGERIQLCEYRSWQRSVPPEDLSQHCGSDHCQRRAGVESAEREHTQRQLKGDLSCQVLYFSTQKLVGTVYVDGTWETTECCGLKQDCGKPLQVRVL